MKNNKIKAVARLSVNPSFNFDFIDEKIYNKSSVIDNIIAEINNETHLQPLSQSRSIIYRGQKSEPSLPKKHVNSTQLKPLRHSKLFLGSISGQQRKGTQSFCIKTTKVKTERKSKQRILDQLKIDSKCQGSHLRMKNYSKWFKD